MWQYCFDEIITGGARALAGAGDTIIIVAVEDLGIVFAINEMIGFAR
jgi:hypothetical protein